MARRLNIAALIPPDQEVDFTDAYFAPEEWRKPLKVRGVLSVPEIALMFQFEQAIQEAQDDPASIRDPINQAYRFVMDLLQEQNPGLPDLPFGVEVTMQVMAFLAGADTVAEAVQDTIRGQSAEEAEAARLERGGEDSELDAEQLAGHAADEAPLPSAKSSPKSSSRSASGSRGGRSGGASAPGEPSVATAPISQVA